MPKYKEQRFSENGTPIRKSEYSEDRECYMDKDGNYVYNTWVKQPNGKYRLEPVCIAKIGEEGVTAEYTILLDDIDCEDDRKNESIRKNRDGAYEAAVADYENDCLDDDGGKKIHPLDKATFKTNQCRDLADLLYGDKPAEDPRILQLRVFMDKLLTEDQWNLFYEHLGLNKGFTEIAAEESLRLDKKVTRQAVQNRWNKIIAKLCKAFGVPVPKRTKSEE